MPAKPEETPVDPAVTPVTPPANETKSPWKIIEDGAPTEEDADSTGSVLYYFFNGTAAPGPWRKHAGGRTHFMRTSDILKHVPHPPQAGNDEFREWAKDRAIDPKDYPLVREAYELGKGKKS